MEYKSMRMRRLSRIDMGALLLLVPYDGGVS